MLGVVGRQSNGCQPTNPIRLTQFAIVNQPVTQRDLATQRHNTILLTGKQHPCQIGSAIHRQR